MYSRRLSNTYHSAEHTRGACMRTLLPAPSTQSPEKRAFSSLSNMQQWSSAWPGVNTICSAAPGRHSECILKIGACTRGCNDVAIMQRFVCGLVMCGARILENGGLVLCWSEYRRCCAGQIHAPVELLMKALTEGTPPTWSWCQWVMIIYTLSNQTAQRLRARFQMLLLYSEQIKETER